MCRLNLTYLPVLGNPAFFVKSKGHSLSTACNDTHSDDYSQQPPNFHYQKERKKGRCYQSISEGFEIMPKKIIRKYYIYFKSAKVLVDYSFEAFWGGCGEVCSLSLVLHVVLGTFIHIQLPTPSQLYLVPYQNYPLYPHHPPPPLP